MSELLENEKGNPTIDLLDKLAAVLDVSISEFFEEAPKGDQRQKTLPGGRPRRKK